MHFHHAILHENNHMSLHFVFERLSRMMRTFGPGIMSTAIGVSHLVQSTRAGAEFGFGLVAIVLLANILKYPFFEFSSRYANATGTSLIDGYKKLGRWALGLYFIITAIHVFRHSSSGIGYCWIYGKFVWCNNMGGGYFICRLQIHTNHRLQIYLLTIVSV